MPAPAACPPPPPRTAPGTARLVEALEEVLRDRPVRPSEVPGRAAAVLLPIYDRDGRAELLLTLRAHHLPHHPGQVSFPGGRPEPVDGDDLVATALRETHEEVGIPSEAVRVIGALDQVHTVATDFVISPFVALVRSPVTPVPNDAEIARVVSVGVQELLLADAGLPPRPTIMELRYPLGGEDIWGATARILRDFCRVARCALAAGG
jgi:8-oxo-dGTP pyrophosphatase MutT (NUDIX family)